MISLGKEYNQIVNLTKFNVNFSRFISNNDLLSHDPSYILAKYNHWIGFEPIVEFKQYTPDDMTNFLHSYWRRWNSYRDNSVEKSTKNILMYLYSTQSMNLLLMVQKFEEYIGPVSMVSDTNKRGLHYKANEFAEDVLKKNSDNIKIVLRDLKIGNII